MIKGIVVVVAAGLGLVGATAATVLHGGADSSAVLLAVAGYVLAGTVVVLARPGDRVGLLMLAGGTAWGIGEGALALGVQGYVVAPGSVPLADWLGVLGTVLRGAGWVVLVAAVPLRFPDGRHAWPGRRWPDVLTATTTIALTLALVLAPRPLESRLEAMDSPTGLPESWTAVSDVLALGSLALLGVLVVVALVGLVRRFRRADDAQRRHLGWFTVAFACPLALIPVVATPLGRPWMFALVALPVPVTIAVTTFERRFRDGRERLVRAREEERRRLRRDLHDGLGPALAALTLRVDTLRNRRSEPDLDLDEELLRLRSGIQDTVADVRRIVEGLRPPALDDLGVGGAIAQLAVAHDGLPVDTDVADLPRLPAAVEVALYRVAQEALANVVRHSAATRARVALTVVDDEVRLDVVDNGRGGAHPRNGGIGLSSMRERAEEIGGSLRISTSGSGTTVALALPLAAQP